MTPLARSKDLVVQKAGNEVLVYDLSNDTAACLNETSALIWENCDGKKSLLEIQTLVEKKFGELVSEDFIKFAVDQLQKENLLDNKEELLTGFDGLSRREVIRRVGFTSMVALPIIASLTAPSAVFAQSSCNTGNACECILAVPAMDPCNIVNLGGCNAFAGCTCMSTAGGTGPGTGTCGV